MSEVPVKLSNGNNGADVKNPRSLHAWSMLCLGRELVIPRVREEPGSFENV